MAEVEGGAMENNGKLKMPPHPGAEAHQRLMKKWREDPTAVVNASVAAGVHNEDGTLTEAYQSPPDDN